MLRVTMTVAVGLLLSTASAQARGFTARQLSDGHVGSAKTELLAQKRHSSQVISFFTAGHRRWMVAPRHGTCWSIPGKRYRRLCDNARTQLRAHQWLYRVSSDRLERMYPSWPAHHLLWLCISSSEGGPTSINPNGHYGMLQMHAGWGYGTSYHASDDPQLVQEQSAERAYAASGYSSSFLADQWFKWDGRYDCLRYA